MAEGACAHTLCFLQAVPCQGTRRGGPHMALRTKVPQSWLRYPTLTPARAEGHVRGEHSPPAPHGPPMPRERGERLVGFRTLLPPPSLSLQADSYVKQRKVA